MKNVPKTYVSCRLLTSLNGWLRSVTISPLLCKIGTNYKTLSWSRHQAENIIQDPQIIWSQYKVSQLLLSLGVRLPVINRIISITHQIPKPPTVNILPTPIPVHPKQNLEISLLISGISGIYELRRSVIIWIGTICIFVNHGTVYLN